jgi:hypothetical protein
MSNHVADQQERAMSKLVKIAVILAVAAVAIAAKQFAAPGTDEAALSLAPSSSVAPDQIMHRAGPLPELKIENLF